MAKKITYNDKVAIIPPGVRENQVWDADMNEIKRVINENADELASLLGLIVVKEDSGNKQNNLSADPSNTKYPTVTAVLNALKASSIQVTSQPIYLTGTTLQEQLNQTEQEFGGVATNLKTNIKNLYQTGLARTDIDTSVVSIVNADTIRITNVNKVLFVNSINPDTNSQFLDDYLQDFGDLDFTINATNTPVNLNERAIYFLGIDATGTKVYKTNKAYDLDICYLIRIAIANTAGVYSFITTDIPVMYFPSLAANPPSDRGRTVKATGTVEPSGAASISFKFSSFSMTKEAVNYRFNKLDPNYLSVPDTIGGVAGQFVFGLPNLRSLSVDIANSTTINPKKFYTAAGTVGAQDLVDSKYQVYRVLLTVVGRIIIQTKASTNNSAQPGINAIFDNVEDATKGLKSTTFPDVLPAGDSMPIGVFYLRAGTLQNGSTMLDPNDFFFDPILASTSSSTVGATTHDGLTGKNDNPAFLHVTTAEKTSWNNKENGLVISTPDKYLAGDKSWQILNTDKVLEATNLYYTEARVNANTNVAANTAARHSAVTLGNANGLVLVGQELSIGLAGAGASGALSAADWIIFNDKQNNISGPSNYLTKYGVGGIVASNITDDGSVVFVSGNFTIKNPASTVGLEFFTAIPNRGILSYDRTLNQYQDFTLRVKDFIISNSDVDRFVFKNNGNVGIGTTNPFATLHVLSSIAGPGNYTTSNKGVVVGESGTNGVLNMGTDASSAFHSWIQSRNTSSATYYPLALNPYGGDVGIGTTNPLTQFHVNKTGQTFNSASPSGGILVTNLLGGNYGLELGTDAANIPWIQSRNVTGAIYYNLAINPNGGNVGIGTNNPQAKLDVQGNGFFTGNVLSDTFGGFSGGDLTITTNTSGTSIIKFFQAQSERMRIGTNGNLLVNTTADNGVDKVQVNGDIKFGDLSIGNNSSPALKRLKAYNYLNELQGSINIHDKTSNTNSTDFSVTLRKADKSLFEPIIIKGDTGNILVNTTTPNGFKVQINGSLSSTNIFDTGTFVTIGANIDLGSKFNVRGTFRNSVQTADTGDTILSGIEGVSAGLQITKSAGNVLTYKFNTGAIANAMVINNDGNATFSNSVTTGPIIANQSITVLGDIQGNGNPTLKTIWGGAYSGALQIKTDGSTTDRYARIGMVGGAGQWLGGMRINNDISATFDGTVSAMPAVLDTQLATLGQVKAQRPYRVYTALISQTGTNNPTVIVLENTFGGDVTITRAGLGNIQGTLPNGIIIPSNKFFFSVTLGSNNIYNSTATTSVNTNSSVFNITGHKDNAQSDGVFTNASIEFRLYN
jgi:hypothetical protein